MLAALPPFAQEIREIDAILHSEEIRQYISSAEVIEKIVKIDEGYVITTDQKTFFVFIDYLPVERPGPRPFALDFVSSIDGAVGLDELDSKDAS